MWFWYGGSGYRRWGVGFWFFIVIGFWWTLWLALLFVMGFFLVAFILLFLGCVFVLGLIFSKLVRHVPKPPRARDVIFGILGIGYAAAIFYEACFYHSPMAILLAGLVVALLIGVGLHRQEHPPEPVVRRVPDPSEEDTWPLPQSKYP